MKYETTMDSSVSSENLPFLDSIILVGGTFSKEKSFGNFEGCISSKKNDLKSIIKFEII